MPEDFKDPLIAWDLRNLDIIFTSILFIGLALLLGRLTRKNPYAMWTTLVTAGLIILLLLVTQNDHGFAFFSLKLE